MRVLRSFLVWLRHIQARKLKLLSAVSPTASPLLFSVLQQGIPVTTAPGNAPRSCKERRPFVLNNGDKLGKSLALNSVHIWKTEREAESTKVSMQEGPVFRR
jgi:hypothetical protein